MFKYGLRVTGGWDRGENRIFSTQVSRWDLSQGFVMFFNVSCEGLPGQQVATVSANQLGEILETLSSKPCDR